jgi:hypothetical protein
MKTIIRRNNWRTLSEGEIENAMPWMKITHRNRMAKALCLLLGAGIPVVVFLVLHVIDNTLTELLKNLWVYLLAGLIVFVGAYFTVDYTRKMKCFAKGEFQAVNVSVTGKAFSNAYRNHYHAVYVSGLFVDDKAVRKKIRVPRRIYNRVSEGDKAFVIKYDYKKTKDPLADLDFVPAAEFSEP